jgi:hypothetical protein
MDGEPAGFTLARQAVLLVVVIAAARSLSLSADVSWALLAALTVAGLASSTSWLTPLAGAALGWLLGTGFLVHPTGELSFAVDDRGHLAVLAFAGLVALGISRLALHSRRTQHGVTRQGVRNG